MQTNWTRAHALRALTALIEFGANLLDIIVVLASFLVVFLCWSLVGLSMMLFDTLTGRLHEWKGGDWELFSLTAVDLLAIGLIVSVCWFVWWFAAGGVLLHIIATGLAMSHSAQNKFSLSRPA